MNEHLMPEVLHKYNTYNVTSVDIIRSIPFKLNMNPRNSFGDFL